MLEQSFNFLWDQQGLFRCFWLVAFMVPIRLWPRLRLGSRGCARGVGMERQHHMEGGGVGGCHLGVKGPSGGANCFLIDHIPSKSHSQPPLAYSSLLFIEAALVWLQCVCCVWERERRESDIGKKNSRQGWVLLTTLSHWNRTTFPVVITSQRPRAYVFFCSLKPEYYRDLALFMWLKMTAFFFFF